MTRNILNRLAGILLIFMLVVGVIPVLGSGGSVSADSGAAVSNFTITDYSCLKVSGSATITIPDTITTSGGMTISSSAAGLKFSAKMVGQDKTIKMTVSNSSLKAGANAVTFYTQNVSGEESKYSGGEYTIKLYVGMGVGSFNLIEQQIASKTVTVNGHIIHSYESADATCETDGFKKNVCYMCGCFRTEIYPATGHSWDAGKVTKAATCTADGVKTTTCTACGEAKTSAIAKKGHVWDGGRVTRPAKYFSTGVKTYTCQRCKATRTATIPKKNVAAVTPARVTITSAKPAKKKVTVKWKRVAKNTKGYQIALKNKNTGKVQNVKVKQSSKAVLSKTIKKLQSKKTYAIRIRAYNVIGSETIYGPWSKVKSGKVK